VCKSIDINPVDPVVAARWLAPFMRRPSCNIYHDASVQRMLFRFIQSVDLCAASDGYKAHVDRVAHVCALFNQEFADLEGS